MRGAIHLHERSAANDVFARLAGPLRAAWRRGAWISARVSRDFSRLPLMNDGWPLCR